jgi:hypothetical protein
MEDSLFEVIKPFFKFLNFTKYKKAKVFRILKKYINEFEKYDFLKAVGIEKIFFSDC